PWATGSALEQSEVPYEPWAQLLRQLLPTIHLTIPEVLDTHLPILSTLLPELGGGAPYLEPAQEAIRLQAVIAELLYTFAATNGLVLFLEDLQWLDARSKELLAYVLRNANGHAILVVGTFRGDPAKEPYADLLEIISLGGLTTAETGMLIASTLGEALISERFIAATTRITAGNPLFVAGLLRHLVAGGQLHQEGTHWIADLELVAEDLPADLRELLIDRFSRLTANARELAVLFAVSGRAITLEVLHTAWRGTGDAFFAALEELRLADLISANQNVWGLNHPAAREAWYASLPEAQLQKLHGRIAKALECCFSDPDPDQILTLAHHYLESDISQGAMPYCLPAGQRAAELFANEQARHILTRGLQLVERNESTASTEQFAMLIILGDVCRIAGDISAASAAFMKAGKLAAASGDEVAQARVAIGMGKTLQLSGDLPSAVCQLEQACELLKGRAETLQHCRALTTLGRIAFFSQDLETATRHYEAALELAHNAELKAPFAEALAFLGYAGVVAKPERLAEGLGQLQDSLAIREEIGDRIGANDTYMLLGNAYLAIGQYSQAHDCFWQCQQLSAMTGHKDEEVFAYLNLAVVALERGDYEAAKDFGLLAASGSEATTDRFTAAIAEGICGIAQCHLGKLSEAIAHFAAAQQRASAIEHRYLEVLLGTYHAEFLLLLGLTESALETAHASCELAEVAGNDELVPPLLALQALAQFGLERYEAATTLLQMAHRQATASSSSGALTKVLRGLAILAIADQQYELAKEHAITGLRLAQEIGAQYLAGEFNLLLGEACGGLGQNGQALLAFRAAQLIAVQKGTPDLLIRVHCGLARADTPGANYQVAIARQQLALLLADLPENYRAAYQLRWQKALRGLDQMFDFTQNSSLEARILRLQHLIDFSLIVNGLHQLSEVMDKAIDLILTITGAERGFLLLFESGVLRCQVYRNLYPEGRTASDYQISRSIAEEVLRTAQPLCLTDAMADDRFKHNESIQLLAGQCRGCNEDHLVSSHKCLSFT
ncbi:MAG: AAA family ATPase, partial [Cyanobacteria bacterium NC_groundwater_1444_Ag_S-0.65um_54_12]|nr:AAA family ATPase [Cyanobacteria bacterium NC_groundwater_1444_Ag_S-0.65um_54_12]